MSVPGDGLEVFCGFLHLGQVNVAHRQLYLKKLYLEVKGEYRILGRNWDKILRVFLLAIHSNLYN
jgi:hypothetical protein